VKSENDIKTGLRIDAQPLRKPVWLFPGGACKTGNCHGAAPHQARASAAAGRDRPRSVRGRLIDTVCSRYDI